MHSEDEYILSDSEYLHHIVSDNDSNSEEEVKVKVKVNAKIKVNIEQINEDNYDNEKECINSNLPILLIDTSTTTGNLYDENKTILNYGYKNAINQLNLDGNYDVILSGSDAKILCNISKTDLFDILENIIPHEITDHVDEIKIIKNKYYKNDNLNCNKLKKNKIPWKNECCNKNLYIFTDGEISLNIQSFMYNFMDMINLKIFKVHIIIVNELNENYFKCKLNLGGNFLQILQGYKIIDTIYEIICYNKFHFNKGYIVISNNCENNKIILYDTLFDIDDIKNILIYFSELIDNAYNSVEISIHESFLKIIYDVILKNNNLYWENNDLYLNNKDKNIINNERLILFSKIFNYNIHKLKFTSDIDIMRSQFNLNYKYMEKYIINDLKYNVIDLISTISDTDYITLPTSTINNKNYCNVIFKINNDIVKTNTIICNNKFNNSAISINNLLLPIFPLKIKMTIYSNIAMRKWIEIIYGNKYKLSHTSNIIIYYVLIDLAYAYVNINDDSIRECYRMIMLIMLDRKRTDNNSKEITYLENNNPKCDEINGIDNIFNNCKNNNNIINNKLLWFCIILITKNKKIINKQYEYCKNIIEKKLGINNDEKDETIFNNIKNILFCKIIKKFKNKYIIDEIFIKNYDKYILYKSPYKYGKYTLDSEKIYLIEEHNINNDIKCSPKIFFNDRVISEIFCSDNIIKCPLCYQILNNNNIVEFESISDLKMEMKIKNKIPKIEIIEKLLYDVNDIKLLDFNINDDDELVNIDNLTFDNTPYNFINKKVIVKSIYDKYVIEVTTLKEFNNIVNSKFKFIKNINFENICIAGGFCRSILLNQEINDIDFFIYGIKCNDKLLKRVEHLLKNIKTQILIDNKHAEFIIINKNNSKVLELICYEGDIENDFDNFIKVHKNICDKKYKDIELNTITQEEFEKYEEFINNKKVLYKIQIILVSYDFKKQILDNFDLDPCKVLYDGTDVYFTNLSHISYKYMINYISQKTIDSTLISSRIKKYLLYGFKIVIDFNNAKVDSDNCTINIQDNLIKYINEQDLNMNISNNISKFNKHSEYIYDENYINFKINNNQLYNSIIIEKNNLYDDITSNDNNNILLSTFEYIFRNNYFNNDDENKKIFYKKIDNNFHDITTFDNGICPIIFEEGNNILQRRKNLMLK
jgi:hypothetical protein